MKLIIDIPDHLYNVIKNKECTNKNVLTKAVENCTPLPKGHGDLIDVNRKITVSTYDEQYEEWGEETLIVRKALNRWSDEGITVKDIVISADEAESEE